MGISSRVAHKASITNQPICKNAGAGGFQGSPNSHKCSVKSRHGLSNQCFRCVFNRPTQERPLGVARMVGKCAANMGAGGDPQEGTGCSGSNAANISS